MSCGERLGDSSMLSRCIGPGTWVFFAAVGLASCAQRPPMLATPTVLTPAIAPTITFIGCSTVGAVPTSGASSALPPVTPADYVRGPASASITLLAYCDFQSAECELFSRVLDELEKNHPKDLKVVVRPLPVPVSVVASLDKSELAARAALAAGDQGKFWELRETLHTRYSEWVRLSPAAFEKWITVRASELKLDMTRFAVDLASPRTTARAKTLYESAMGMGLSGIPTVFINGELQARAALSRQGLDSTISLIALGPRQFRTCPPFDIDPSRQYRATIRTAKGDIVIQLFVDKAPLAVNSFVFLAQHAWFDDVTFHRVIPGFVAQAGDPSGTGRGGPGYFFKNEIRSDLQFDGPGVVGMANSGPDTNGSQFFITFGAQPRLDGSYTIFGHVIAGMDVAERLTARDPDATTGPPVGDKILSVTIAVQ
jgi:cyclophilin family peptidyl-prolyl cis-trans isomerase/protein-disulfide isomerase